MNHARIPALRLLAVGQRGTRCRLFRCRCLHLLPVRHEREKKEFYA